MGSWALKSKTDECKKDFVDDHYSFFCCFLVTRKPELTDSASLLETFKFLENAAAEFSDEDEEEDIEGREKTIIDTSTVGQKIQLKNLW